MQDLSTFSRDNGSNCRCSHARALIRSILISINKSKRLIEVFFFSARIGNLNSFISQNEEELYRRSGDNSKDVTSYLERFRFRWYLPSLQMHDERV